MDRVTWNAALISTMLALGALLAPIGAQATIPDANIVAGVNRGGIGLITGAYGQADFALSPRTAIGAYFGFDPDDVYFGDYDNGDGDDLVGGGHFMYQFLEGDAKNPSIAGIFGLYGDQDGLQPEVGLGLSYPFDAKWTGRANIVYGPSWGFELGYRFNPSLEGTFGITGMGLVGLGFRF